MELNPTPMPSGLLYWVIGQHRQDVQQMGGSHLLPLGASPMQGVNQCGHMAHTALQFFIFHISNTTMV